MPSKSTSKSATTSTAKSPRQSKSKPMKSSEYVDDSDLDDDEPMTDAPPAKTTPKATEKTSKKRNRDGTEKVNGARSSSSKKGKESAAAPDPKSVKDKKKKSKKVVEVVEESSEEESKSESSEGRRTKTLKTTQFKLPLDKDVPPGFTPLDITSAGSISSSLGGKQIFLFTAPSKFKFSDVKKIKLHSGLEGETIESDDVKFTIRRSVDAVSSSMKVMVPKQGKKGYQLASVAPAAQYLITEAPPSGRMKVGEQGLPPPPRKQPEGLRMRFMPAGYGEESDYRINEAVLPRKDLVADGDHDVVMDEAEPVVVTPKKAKKSESQVAEIPKEKKKKKSKAVEEVATIEEDVPEEETEKKKSKKEKKDKSRDEDGKKEKKSKRDEEGKKEKKRKHKKEKAEA
ncbi:uncharacterized protein DFL_008671 [Arthrobotrys flagrans]|uniref:DNA-directed RNA polymerase I subunit RPA34.5 n=1 Tax=Arthrobotrys flagrans TaxID=97331 RepID=A0A436ZPG3_ARTFL|nr:hypothetical protein DFL_008671 [Arthrobotrys flagrans]